MKISNDIVIYIVEDDPAQAQLLQDKMLDFNNEYKLEWFSSGENLLAHLKNGFQKYKYSYVILDYFLQTKENKEAINGFEVITRLKKVSPKSNVILYSAFESDADKKFDTLKEEPNVLDVIKKTEYSFSSLQNIIRYNYSKKTLAVRKKRFQWFALFFVLLCH